MSCYMNVLQKHAHIQQSVPTAGSPEYLRSFFRLQFPDRLPLMRDTFIQVGRRAGSSRGGGGGGGRRRRSSRGSKRGHPGFVILTGRLFELGLESEELLHCNVNLVLVPSTNPFTAARRSHSEGVTCTRCGVTGGTTRHEGDDRENGEEQFGAEN